MKNLSALGHRTENSSRIDLLLKDDKPSPTFNNVLGLN